MARTKRRLLRLGEELVHDTVQDHLAYVLDRDELLGPELRRVEDVEVEFVLVGFGDDLDPELPFRVGAVLEEIPDYLRMFAAGRTVSRAG